MYKVGDIYKENVVFFDGIDKNGKIKTRKSYYNWTVIKVCEDSTILCEREGELKIFKI